MLYFLNMFGLKHILKQELAYSQMKYTQMHRDEEQASKFEELYFKSNPSCDKLLKDSESEQSLTEEEI